jgi:hypothetical protein
VRRSPCLLSIVAILSTMRKMGRLGKQRTGMLTALSKWLHEALPHWELGFAYLRFPSRTFAEPFSDP